VLGTGPYTEYLFRQLGPVASGAAVASVDQDFLSAVNNVSPYGIVAKLRWAGVAGMSRGLATAVIWLYTLVPVGIAVRARCAPEDRLAQAQVWLGILNLAALRSPNAPGVYVLGGTLWLLTLLAADLRGRRAAAALAACWLLFLGVPPLPWQRPLAIVSVVPSILCVGLNVWSVLRVSRCAERAARRTPMPASWVAGGSIA
jgi:hypothetical protein